MPNDIITITEATEKKAGPSMKCSYTDATGKKWHSWKDTLQLHAGETYELLEIETKKWSPKDHPDREYTDYVIKKAKKVAAAVPTIGVASQIAHPKTNGHASIAADRDESIFVQAVVKAPTWTDYESLRERVQAAKRVYREEILGIKPEYRPAESENPGDDMEGTPFGR